MASRHGPEIDGWSRVLGGAWAWRGLWLLLAQRLAVFAGGVQFAIALGEDGSVASFEFVLGGDIADGAVQADGVVVVHVIGHNASRIFQGQGYVDADTTTFQGAVPAFQFTVALGMVGRSADVSHAAQADELFEVLGNELGAVVGDNPGCHPREAFAGPL